MNNPEDDLAEFDDSIESLMSGENGIIFNSELVLDDMLFEVSIEFVPGTSYANGFEKRPLNGFFSNLPRGRQEYLISHATELLQNNIQDFSRIQVWTDEFDQMLFLLVPRSHLRDEEIKEITYLGMQPPDSAIVIDSIQITDEIL